MLHFIIGWFFLNLPKVPMCKRKILQLFVLIEADFHTITKNLHLENHYSRSLLILSILNHCYSPFRIFCSPFFFESQQVVNHYYPFLSLSCTSSFLVIAIEFCSVSIHHNTNKWLWSTVTINFHNKVCWFIVLFLNFQGIGDSSQGFANFLLFCLFTKKFRVSLKLAVKECLTCCKSPSDDPPPRIDTSAEYQNGRRTLINERSSLLATTSTSVE